jgi:hypothetical protein
VPNRDPDHIDVDINRHIEDKSHRTLDVHAATHHAVDKGGRRDELRTDNRRSDRSAIQRRPSLEGRLSTTRERELPSFEARISDRFSNTVDEARIGTMSRAHQDRAFLPTSQSEIGEPNTIINGGRNSYPTRSRKKGRPFDQ